MGRVSARGVQQQNKDQRDFLRLDLPNPAAGGPSAAPTLEDSSKL